MSDPLDIMDYSDEVDQYKRLRTRIADVTEELTKAERDLRHFSKTLERHFYRADDHFCIEITGRDECNYHRTIRININENNQFDEAFRQELVRRIKLSLIDAVDQRVKKLKHYAKQYGDEPKKEVTEETDEIPF